MHSHASTAAAAPARPPKVESGLAACLRLATAEAHDELEAALGLLSEVPDRQRFLRVLDRFYGFHAVWEHAIRRHRDLARLHAPRTRLPHLRRDLAALGRTSGEIRALPLCLAAHHLLDDPDEAVGSLYVMEGSTLGGQIIARELADADWLPAGGLTYFHPYGRRTGEMWRTFRAWADDRRPDRKAAARGAQRTFALLKAWAAA
jgi:heme oxygenase